MDSDDSQRLYSYSLPDVLIMQLIGDDYTHQPSSAIRNHMVTTFGKQTSMKL